MIDFFSIFWPVILFILGLCLGSFGNVIIARLPNEESVVKPRSKCPHCKSTIKWHDNVPIFSYLLLRAKCRACKKAISIRYPLVELICGLLFVALYYRYGISWTLVETLIFVWAGVVASVIDLDHRILPDVFTLSGIVVGLVGALLSPERHFLDSVIGIIAGGGFLWAVAFVYSAIKHEEGMGGGDIKLLAWIGAVLGWHAVVFSILVSSITGSAIGGFYAFSKKSGMKTSIPFGPFLVFAAIMYIFFGPPLIQSYLAIFFPFTN